MRKKKCVENEECDWTLPCTAYPSNYNNTILPSAGQTKHFGRKQYIRRSKTLVVSHPGIFSEQSQYKFMDLNSKLNLRKK